MQSIKEMAWDRKNYLTQIRTELHQHPELSFKEFETSKLIKRELALIGIPFFCAAQTGVIAEIRGGLPGKTIALRADMDALEISEEQSLMKNRSLNPGVMHACGHDLHIASLLAAAQILWIRKEYLHGTVKLIFQPAEECVQGACAIMQDDASLKQLDAIFGFHVMPDYPTGNVYCRNGGIKMAGERFTIHVKGQEGHGAEPHEAVDALLTGSAIVMNTQAILGREMDPREAAVVTICKMSAGCRHNIIAGQAELQGTIRGYSEKTILQLKNALSRMVDFTAKTYRAEATVEFDLYVPPVTNDAYLGDIVKTAVQKIVGPENVKEAMPTTASDDFAFYTEHIRGYYLLVGCGGEHNDASTLCHTPGFMPNEDCMPIAAACYAQFAEDYLKDLNC